MIQNKTNDRIINIISIAIPIAVAVILGIPYKIDLGVWTKQLPHGIGLVNALTAVCLLVGYFAVKSKNILVHRISMGVAFCLGAVFLLMYIAYHISNPSTSSALMPTGLRYLYIFLLLSHIILSIGVVRFVLLAIYYALTKQIDRHKSIVKYTLPVWLYVSVSGVLVYILISPYYK
jgi:putative membrane protein